AEEDELLQRVRARGEQREQREHRHRGDHHPAPAPAIRDRPGRHRGDHQAHERRRQHRSERRQRDPEILRDHRHEEAHALRVEAEDAVQRSAPNGVDFTGEWAPRFHEDEPERVPVPELGDYLGIPINDAARMRATTWEASIQTLPEWQCRPHSADYIWRGPSPLRIWKEVDPVSRQVVAWHAEWLRSVDRSIYMDGRPHPSPNAPHTWAA